MNFRILVSRLCINKRGNSWEGTSIERQCGIPQYSNGIIKLALHVIWFVNRIAIDVQCFISDWTVVTQESITSQSGDRTGVQIATGFAAHIHTATGTSGAISLHFRFITVAKQASFTLSKSWPDVFIWVSFQDVPHKGSFLGQSYPKLSTNH